MLADADAIARAALSVPVPAADRPGDPTMAQARGTGHE
jgi:hypothetical protein